MNLSKTIFVLFNLIMIGYFAYGFLFPKESDFWLVTTGFPIILLEFLTVFVVFTGADSFNNRRSKRQKSLSLLVLLGLFLTAFGFCFSIGNNPLLFGYFVLSSAVKIFRLKDELAFIRSNPAGIRTNSSDSLKAIGYSAAAIIFGAIIAVPLSFFAIFFPAQQGLLREALVQNVERTGGTISGIVVDNPGFIACWGILYFLLLLLFELFPNFIKFESIKPKSG